MHVPIEIVIKATLTYRYNGRNIWLKWTLSGGNGLNFSMQKGNILAERVNLKRWLINRGNWISARHWWVSSIRSKTVESGECNYYWPMVCSRKTWSIRKQLYSLNRTQSTRGNVIGRVLQEFARIRDVFGANVNNMQYYSTRSICRSIREFQKRLPCIQKDMCFIH